MNRQSGVTLLELMVGVAIVTVVVSLAVPNVAAWMPHYRLKAAARDLFSDFQRTKMTAIRTNTTCVVAFGQAVDGHTWDYVAFEDDDGDFEFDAGELIIARVDWDDYRSIAADAQTFTANDDGLASIGFRPNGIPTGNGGGFAQGTCELTNTKGKKLRVIVSQAGNIRINQP